MKLLEDSFSYANQLGARQGAGAVYLHAHHPDIYRFLDTKRENADEKIRIKTLSLGVVIPDITFELARNNEDMYLFSPVRRRARLRRAVRRHLGHREVLRDGRRRAHPQDQDQGARVLPDAGRAAIRVRLPVHHVRGHGQPGQPDRGQDHPLQPVLGDPAGVHAVVVQRRPVVCQSGQRHFVQPGLAEHRQDDGLAGLRPEHRGGDPRADRGERPDPHLVGALDRAGQQRLARDRAGADEPARLPGPGARLLRLRRGRRLHQHLLLHRALPRAARLESHCDRTWFALQGLRAVQVRVGGVLRQVHRAGLGTQDRQGASAFRRCRHPHPEPGRLAAAERVGADARHLQPEPAGGAADRIDLLHQPLDVVDPPDRVEGRDPQGRQDRPRLLPGALS